MGRIHIILKDKVEKLLRRKLGKSGFKKGDMSKYIEDLIVKDLKCNQLR